MCVEHVQKFRLVIAFVVATVAVVAVVVGVLRAALKRLTQYFIMIDTSTSITATGGYHRRRAAVVDQIRNVLQYSIIAVQSCFILDCSSSSGALWWSCRRRRSAAARTQCQCGRCSRSSSGRNGRTQRCSRCTTITKTKATRSSSSSMSRSRHTTMWTTGGSSRNSILIQATFPRHLLHTTTTHMDTTSASCMVIVIRLR
mmetsp:Transcript_2115/g.3359  ORF Transcript_2115/g.3359 Transcript_2115/m.3359 type:complete len:200 (+) Transcript_2115:1523-2122(+)